MIFAILANIPADAPQHRQIGMAVALGRGQRSAHMSSMPRELFALRRALWEVAERAQRAIAQFDVYVKVQHDADRSGAAGIQTSDDRDQKSDTPMPAPGALIAGAALRAALRPGHSREVARALRHIELNFDKPIGLARLARIAGCSRSTLTRAFRREIGQTAHTYLVGIRLARAASAMTSGDKVEAVMLGAGFRSKRNFYRLFKTQFGLTPSQFCQAKLHQADQGGETSTPTLTGSA
jgi:AraC-like DNA-binding protein